MDPSLLDQMAPANTAEVPNMAEEVNPSEVDRDILADMAGLILEEPEGAKNLVAAAQNTNDPAVGVAQFIMMMMEAQKEMLTQAGITVDYGAWLVENGALDILMPEIMIVLEDGGVQLAEGFESGVFDALVERVKGAADAETAGPPSGSPTANAAGVLDQMAPAPMGGM